MPLLEATVTTSFLQVTYLLVLEGYFTSSQNIPLMSESSQNSPFGSSFGYQAAQNLSKSGHDMLSLAKSTTNPGSEFKRKFNMNTPSFQPSVANLTGKFSALLPKLKDIPTFVPTGGFDAGSVATPSDTNPSFSSRKFNASTPSFTPSNPYDNFSTNSANTDFSLDGFPSHDSASSATDQMLMSQMGLANNQKSQPNPYLSTPGTPSASAMGHSGNSASAFMFHGQTAPNYPLNYHLYSPAPPPRLAVGLDSHETNVNNLFIPNDLRETITKRNEAALQSLGQLSLPEHVGNYHSLVPIDSTFDQISKVYKRPATVYKVMSNVDGLVYALRRIDMTGQTMSEGVFHTVKVWQRINNPNVVRLKDAFTSVAFDGQEPSLCLAYDYYPLSNTLQEQHMTRKLGVKLEPVTENLLWNYLIQLVGALISIHSKELHAGLTLSTSKIIVTNKNRIRLASGCVDDILRYEEIVDLEQTDGQAKTTLDLQRKDISLLAAVMTELTATTLHLLQRSEFSDKFVTSIKSSANKAFSDEWIDVLQRLNNADASFNLKLFYSEHLSVRSLDMINGLQDLTDYFEGQLLSEVENGRLFRLVAKLMSLIDQPGCDGDLGNNGFVLKLFRDFVFHARDESGKPSVDLSRILVNLNKLDVGIDEKILLVSSEEDTCMIVSYKEVKDILELSFRAVFRGN